MALERCLPARFRLEPESEQEVCKRTCELADDMRTSHGSNQFVLVGTDRAA